MTARIEQAPFGSARYKQTLELRYEVLRKPIGMVLREKDVATDDKEFHFAALDDDKVIGCVLLRPLTQNHIKLRQMAVADSHQGMGIGAMLVRHAEDFARAKGFASMETNARKTAQGFYEKMGFAPVGDEFMEVDLHTIKMEKHL